MIVFEEHSLMNDWIIVMKMKMSIFWITFNPWPWMLKSCDGENLSTQTLSTYYFIVPFNVYITAYINDIKLCVY